MGKSGSVRARALDASTLGAMQDHELRHDLSGRRRRVREVAPLVYSPHGDALDLKGSYEAHVVGTKRSKGATKLALHAFVQFPTDIEIDREAERMMLREAVAFIDKHHGGRAVFRARLDRDEAGRHGVDVFYAPRYEKRTKRRSAEWVSLTRFGKELARERFGQRPVLDKETGEPVTGPDGEPELMWNDGSYFQGRALQDLWFQHLRDEVGLDWAVRGERKIGRDPDRLEPEEYKLRQERAKLERQREADIEEAIRRNQIIERSGQLATDARDRMMAKAREQEALSTTRVEELRAREKATAAKEADLARREKELAKEVEWTTRVMGNVRVAVDQAMSGRHLEEIAAEDMAAEPKKFAALRKAAPGGRVTRGFQAEFWAFNFSDSGTPAPVPQAVREAGRKVFACVAEFARERLKLFEATKAQALAAAVPEIEAARRTARDEGLREARAEAERVVRAAKSAAEGHLASARSRAAEIEKGASATLSEAQRAHREAVAREVEVSKREDRLDQRSTSEVSDRERFFEHGFTALVAVLRKALTPDGFAKVEQAYQGETRERHERRQRERREEQPAPSAFTSSYRP